jgi:molybdopterin-binding protein
MKISAHNILKGKIKITSGAVNTEIFSELPGDQLVSIISKESATKLDSKPGKAAYAVIKTSNIMIAVD